jgi:hypothetical protein
MEYDYAFCGSSRSYNGINISMIDSISKKKGINLSLDGSEISTQSVLMNLFLQKNSLKTIYLQIDYWNVNSELTNDIADARLLPYLDSEICFDHYKQFGFKWFLYRYVPFWKYAEFNYYWGPVIFFNSLFNVRKPEFDIKTGSLYYPNGKFLGKNVNQNIIFQKDASFKYLKEIIAMCDSKGIKLVLFTAPYSVVLDSKESKTSIDEFFIFCKKQKVTYYNFSGTFNKQFSLFYDDVHLNKNGADSFSIFFANSKLFNYENITR